jgi:hypothetical protein
MAAAHTAASIHPLTLRIRDAKLEQRFWDSWALPMLIGDVADASISATCGTLMLLNRLGKLVRWDFVSGDLWWLVLAVVLARLVNIAAVLLARRSYLRHRFTFHAALKLFMCCCVSPRFMWLSVQQLGPHSWAMLGGRDGRVESHQGIVRALLLLNSAYSCLNLMLLPPFRLPWRLMAPPAPAPAAAPAARRRPRLHQPFRRGAPAGPVPPARQRRVGHMPGRARLYCAADGPGGRERRVGRPLRRQQGAQLHGPLRLPGAHLGGPPGVRVRRWVAAAGQRHYCRRLAGPLAARWPAAPRRACWRPLAAPSLPSPS